MKAKEVTTEEIWASLEKVKDPEIPVISVVDMGMITGVTINSLPKAAKKAQITFTPTFVGCPALEHIKKNIREEILLLGFEEVEVHIDFETKWTSDRISPEAKIKLEKFGLAPPPDIKEEELTLEQLNKVRCPHCGSTDTTLRSAFGSTLCRAIRFCFTCQQGFEQFKPV